LRALLLSVMVKIVHPNVDSAGEEGQSAEDKDPKCDPPINIPRFPMGIP